MTHPPEQPAISEERVRELIDLCDAYAVEHPHQNDFDILWCMHDYLRLRQSSAPKVESDKAAHYELEARRLNQLLDVHDKALIACCVELHRSRAGNPVHADTDAAIAKAQAALRTSSQAPTAPEMVQKCETCGHLRVPQDVACPDCNGTGLAAQGNPVAQEVKRYRMNYRIGVFTDQGPGVAYPADTSEPMVRAKDYDTLQAEREELRAWAKQLHSALAIAAPFIPIYCQATRHEVDKALNPEVCISAALSTNGAA